MRLKFLFFGLLAFGIATAQKKPYLLIGSYTSGKAIGISVYSFNSKTGEDSFISVAKTKNPSYLAVSKNNKFVYAVNETQDTTGTYIGGGVTAFSFNAVTGTLTQLDEQQSGGKDPCYVSVTNNGKYVFAGNYSSGTLATFPVKLDGSIDVASQIITHSGKGPNKDRQEGPHVHSTVLSPDDNYLFVPNLGTDKVMIYSVNKTTGKLTPAPTPFTATDGGTGPRHLEFAPNKKYAYLIEEMGGNIVTYQYNNGVLKKIQNISILQKDFKGDVGAADIHVSHDGKFLYSSNRGTANDITIFSINKKNGKLAVVGYQSTLGETPRNFNFDPTGNFLLAANQKSDDVIIFKVNKKTGLLTDTGKRILVGNPVCIKWIN